ncbi:MAG: metallophosphoesterase family protein [Bacteroidetes bacterium]|nr:metallophosphoesterase family protein [Bacteroidota bacterium]
MKRIGLLSDTHSYLDPKVFTYFEECDEIWHAGDIGSMEVIESLEQFKPLKAVYGNIDNHQIRSCTKKDLRFNCEGMDVWITHIGGYPGRYQKRVREIMNTNPPDLFICGHSHILKVMPDKKYKLLHINPGSCGKYGFHKIRTIIRFTLDKSKVNNMEVIELGKRGQT